MNFSQRSYWCGPKENDPGDEIPLVSQSDSNSEFFEVEPSNEPGVVIKNLSKVILITILLVLAISTGFLNVLNIATDFSL